MHLKKHLKPTIEDAQIVIEQLKKYNGKHHASFYGVLDVAVKIIEDWIKIK